MLISVVGCSKFRTIQKSTDWRVKYEAGFDYYEKKDYYRAAALFDEIQAIVRGLPEGEQVAFFLAYCQFYEKTYLLAANQFKTFYETYGRSALAEEAQFMYAYSLYKSSPPPNLDQRGSIEAMDAMQTFINIYPASRFVEQAVQVINESQQKLEEKGYENARHYLKLRMYQAAIIAFDNFRDLYPDSKYLEEIASLKVMAQYELADRSFQSLQEKRFKQVVDFYQELVDNYPNSRYIRNVERMYTESLVKLKQLKKNNS
jgi:outer membrane protein assembly factor BamD